MSTTDHRPAARHNPLVAAGSEARTNQETLALVRALEASDRFRRDTPWGGILHHNKISFREIAPLDSLHILIDGNRVSAHVDRISPLDCRPGRSSHYSWTRVLAHNLAGVAGQIALRLTGRHGQQRCNLECEVVWLDDEETTDVATEPAGDAA